LTPARRKIKIVKIYLKEGNIVATESAGKLIMPRDLRKERVDYNGNLPKRQ
jgi:hypothetical protein